MPEGSDSCMCTNENEHNLLKTVFFPKSFASFFTAFSMTLTRETMDWVNTYIITKQFFPSMVLCNYILTGWQFFDSLAKQIAHTAEDKRDTIICMYKNPFKKTCQGAKK